jgi:hypothetical protein
MDAIGREMPVPKRTEVRDWIIRLLDLGYKSKIDIDKRLRAIFHVSFVEQEQRAGKSPTSRVQNDLDWGWSVAQNPGGYVRKIEEGMYELTMIGKDRAARIARRNMTQKAWKSFFYTTQRIIPGFTTSEHAGLHMSCRASSPTTPAWRKAVVVHSTASTIVRRNESAP